MKKESELEDAYYIRFIDYLQSTEGLSLKEKEYFLKKIILLNNQLHTMPCVFYLLDFQNQKYLYVSENVDDFIGYTFDNFLKHGHEWFLSLFHPEDAKEYMGYFFKEFVQYTISLDKKEVKNARFSINYRIKHKENNYIQLLDQFVVLETDKKNNPIIVLGTFNDLTSYKSDTKIIFTISKFDSNCGNKLIISKSYPENTKMTAKEKEIIALLKQGETSKSIAEILNISYLTVNTHRKNILEKLNLKNTAELINHLKVNGINY